MVSRLFIDEAHEILVSQPERIPVWSRFTQTTQESPLQRIFLTATLPPHMEEQFIAKAGCLPTLSVIRESGNRPELSYNVIGLTRGHSFNAWTGIIRLAGHIQASFHASGSDDRCLVFFQSVDEVDRFAAKFDCAKYHSRLSPSEKEANKNAWDDGTHLVMAATTSLGQGIHRSNVRHVLFYQNAYGCISYSQATGRAGRDGKFAHTTLVYDESQALSQKKQEASTDAGLLLNMIHDQTKCRRWKLGKNMDGKARAVKCTDDPTCNHCDYCKPEGEILLQLYTWINKRFEINVSKNVVSL